MLKTIKFSREKNTRPNDTTEPTIAIRNPGEINAVLTPAIIFQQQSVKAQAKKIRDIPCNVVYPGIFETPLFLTNVMH